MSWILWRYVERRELSKESEFREGTKNDQKQEGGNGKKLKLEIRICGN